MRAGVGIALVVDGILSQDAGHGYPRGVKPARSSLHGELHNAAAVVVIPGLAAGCFVLAWRFWSDPAWRDWALFAFATGVLTLVFITAFGMYGGSGAWPESSNVCPVV